MSLFTFQSSVTDKHGEITVFDSKFLDSTVEPLLEMLNVTGKKYKRNLNELPDGIRPWTKNVTTRHIIILDHLCFSDNLHIAIMRETLNEPNLTVPFRVVLVFAYGNTQLSLLLSISFLFFFGWFFLFFRLLWLLYTV